MPHEGRPVCYHASVTSTLEEIRTKATPVFKKYGVKRARIFGSFARGEARQDSDVDLVVEFKQPLGFEYFSMLEELEQNVGREVDIMTEESINKFFRPYIIPELQPFYDER